MRWVIRFLSLAIFLPWLLLATVTQTDHPVVEVPAIVPSNSVDLGGAVIQSRVEVAVVPDTDPDPARRAMIQPLPLDPIEQDDITYEPPDLSDLWSGSGADLTVTPTVAITQISPLDSNNVFPDVTATSGDLPVIDLTPTPTPTVAITQISPLDSNNVFPDVTATSGDLPVIDLTPTPTPTVAITRIAPLDSNNVFPDVTAIPRDLPVIDLTLTSTPTPMEDTPPVPANNAVWGPLVRATWEGYKANYIFCGVNCGNNIGLVFDPFTNYSAVSEGVGYGLLMAVMMDDQPTFNVIYEAAHEVLLIDDMGLFNWRADNNGIITGSTSATDAEIDIAMALIFAERRVQRGEWQPYLPRPYGERARNLLDAIYEYEVADGRYLKPGNTFGDGRNIINLSYFAPAWFRLFDRFEGSNRWEPLIDQGYRSLQATEGASLGLAPDWSTVDGDPAFDYCDETGRERSLCRYDMTYDAIRVPWRIGLDCLWFDEPRACEWSQRSARFMSSLPAHQVGRMYDMDGSVVFNYQDEAMVSMWLVGMVAANSSPLRRQLESIMLRYGTNTINTGYWGDADSRLQYYNQSLAWFAASLLSGDFRNLY